MHYHVHVGFSGCIPENTATFENEAAALEYAHSVVEDWAESEAQAGRDFPVKALHDYLTRYYFVYRDLHVHDFLKVEVVDCDEEECEQDEEW